MGVPFCSSNPVCCLWRSVSVSFCMLFSQWFLPVCGKGINDFFAGTMFSSLPICSYFPWYFSFLKYSYVFSSSGHTFFLPCEFKRPQRLYFAIIIQKPCFMCSIFGCQRIWKRLRWSNDDIRMTAEIERYFGNQKYVRTWASFHWEDAVFLR